MMPRAKHSDEQAPTLLLLLYGGLGRQLTEQRNKLLKVQSAWPAIMRRHLLLRLLLFIVESHARQGSKDKLWLPQEGDAARPTAQLGLLAQHAEAGEQTTQFRDGEMT